MQRLLLAEWKRLSIAQLADTIMVWLATRINEKTATELLHAIETNNWTHVRIFAVTAPTDLVVSSPAANKRL